MFASKWPVLAGSLALILVAAKAHGRQLRLERERAGYWDAVFGGENPEWVEALWRRERILFWSAAAGAALIGLAYAWAASRHLWPMPLPDQDGIPPPWALLLLAAAWPFAFAFILTGLASIARLAASLGSGPTPSQTWLRNAWVGTAGWWALTLALALWIGFASSRKSG
ncbi:MAG: hypothetical protein JWO30_3650 [Fibrobacteres bacterium]|nr:hypothetical protein [Fibrobacterota bacterium]